VFGCNADLQFERRYCQRKNVCHDHMKVCFGCLAWLCSPSCHATVRLSPHSGSVDCACAAQAAAQ
jgi:hypothetical protein